MYYCTYATFLVHGGGAVQPLTFSVTVAPPLSVVADQKPFFFGSSYHETEEAFRGEDGKVPTGNPYPVEFPTNTTTCKFPTERGEACNFPTPIEKKPAVLYLGY